MQEFRIENTADENTGKPLKIRRDNKRLTAEQSRRFDILQAKENTFLSADGCSEGRVSFPRHGNSWNAVMEQNWTFPSKDTEEWQKSWICIEKGEGHDFTLLH